MNIHATTPQDCDKVHKELKVIAQKIFGASFDYLGLYNYDYGTNTDDGYILYMIDYAALTLNQLVELTEAVETKLIDIRYTAAGPDYSEYTAGDPAEFVIIIRRN